MPNHRTALALTSLAALSFIGVRAGAQITAVDLFAANYFRQTNTVAPTAAESFAFSAALRHSGLDDFTEAYFHPGVDVMPAAMHDSGFIWTYTSPVFATAADRDAAFPPEPYTVTVAGGTTGDALIARFYPYTNGFAPKAPSFDAFYPMQAVDPRDDFSLMHSRFVVPSWAEEAWTFLAVYDADGHQVLSGHSEPSATEFLIPDGTFLPNHDYTVTLTFSVRIMTSNYVEGGFVSRAGWDSVTIATLHTIRTCATADFDGDGDVGTDADIEAFFACLSGNCCLTCFSQGVDINGDGDIGTDADIEAFFRILAGSEC